MESSRKNIIHMTKCIYVSKNENIVSKNADTSTKIDLFLLVFMKKNTHFKSTHFCTCTQDLKISIKNILCWDCYCLFSLCYFPGLKSYLHHSFCLVVRYVFQLDINMSFIMRSRFWLQLVDFSVFFEEIPWYSLWKQVDWWIFAVSCCPYIFCLAVSSSECRRLKLSCLSLLPLCSFVFPLECTEYPNPQTLDLEINEDLLTLQAPFLHPCGNDLTRMPCLELGSVS